MVRKWYKRGQICGVSDCLDGQRGNCYDVSVTLDRQASKSRLYLGERCSIFLSVLDELCASSRGTRGVADDPVRILGKNESQDPEFEKEYLSTQGDAKTRQRTSARYRNRRAFQKNQRRMIARPGPAI